MRLATWNRPVSKKKGDPPKSDLADACWNRRSTRVRRPFEPSFSKKADIDLEFSYDLSQHSTTPTLTTDDTIQQSTKKKRATKKKKQKKKEKETSLSGHFLGQLSSTEHESS